MQRPMLLSKTAAIQPFGQSRPRLTRKQNGVCQGVRQGPQLANAPTPTIADCQAPFHAESAILSKIGQLAASPRKGVQASGAPALTSRAFLPGSSFLAVAAATVLAASLATGVLPAEAAAPAADTASVLSIPGIVGDSPLREGIVSGFLLIFFSEIGDKTFFIALLLALKQPKGLVFTGTFGALAVMTVISVLLGQVLHQVDELVPGESNLPFDDLLAVALLLYFGVKTLQDAKDADESAAEEKEEAKEVVEGLKGGGEDALRLILTTFTLVFAAEWGDKSFLATIALAAASSPLGVTAGAVAGHGVATGLAVAGGGFLSQYFSERVLQYVGGSLFLVFAAATIVDIFV